jgi:D-tyrosyl-tRNA(Tyr) deacylase
MRLVIQRVLHAEVAVSGEQIGKIGKGLLVLVGIGSEDTEKDVDRYLSKLIRLRIFEDQNGKTNLSLSDVGGGLLLVSQFTLLADVSEGNRPGFSGAGDPERAEELYEYMIRRARETVPVVEHGLFGADMQVSLTNDGPFTIVLDESTMRRKKEN